MQGHLPDRLTAIVDVGAAAFDTPPSYRSMLEAELCTVIGFDPQKQYHPKPTRNLTIRPDVIGDGNPAKLHIFSAPGMASVLAPEWSMLNALSSQAAGGPTWGKLLHTEDVQTRRIDDIVEIEHMDMLRMDAQGAEMMILQGGLKKLLESVCVQTEVSFVPLYEKQPLFGDIHEFLSVCGFIFHTFTEFQVRTIGPSQGRGKHIIQADAVYVKDFRDMTTWTKSQLQHMALIARHCFQSDDLAYRCIKRLEDMNADHGAGQGDEHGCDRSGELSGSAGGRPAIAGNGVEQRG